MSATYAASAVNRIGTVTIDSRRSSECPYSELGRAIGNVSTTGLESSSLYHKAIDSLLREEVLRECTRQRLGTLCNYRVLSVSRNPNLTPGQPVYDRFARALTVVVSSEGVANVQGSAHALASFSVGQVGPLRLLFHGTHPQNLKSILESGMDPRMRRSGGEWFGSTVDMCKYSNALDNRGHRFLIFLVAVTDSTLMRASYKKGVVTVTSPDLQLPLGIVTIES